MTPTRIIWGQRIEAARKAADLRQVQLAAALKVTQQLVSAWERGVCSPRVDLRGPIARILGVPPEELFSYDTDGNGGEAAA